MYPSASATRSRSMGLGQNEGMLFAPGLSEQALILQRAHLNSSSIS